MRKGVIIAIIIFLLIVAGGLYLLHSFLNALAPPRISITESYISTDGRFSNGITIEQVSVDSIGETHPVKYTVTYLATCHVGNTKPGSSDLPDTIYFKRKGDYWWTTANANISYAHSGLTREPIDPVKEAPDGEEVQRFSTCPLQFQKGQWYFFTIGDPQVVGIFFFIGKDGKPQQYVKESGVSPI